MVRKPLGLLAELTHRCPLGCPYCSNPLALDLREDELDTPTWLRVFGEAVQLGVMQVHLSGGEPGARRDLVEITRHTHRSGKDSIDHARGAHDDYANAVAGVLRDLSAYYGYDAELLGRAYALNDVPKPVLSPKWRHHHPQFTDEEYARITAPVPFGPFPR